MREWGEVVRSLGRRHALGRVDPVSTGFATLDDLTGGFGESQVWVVTGVPGQGRSTLLLQWTGVLAARHGWRVESWFPGEDEEACVRAVTAGLARVPREQALPVDATDHHERVAAAHALLGEADLWLSAGVGAELDVPHVRVHEGPTAVVVDDAHRVGHGTLDHLRRVADTGTLVVASVPRHLVMQGREEWSDLRPEWAYGADVVVEVRTTGEGFDPDAGSARLNVLRNRRGVTRSFEVSHRPQHARFVELVSGQSTQVG